MDFDHVIAGPCEVCGKPGRLVADPYDQDVNNRTTLVVLCVGCEQNAADDI